MQRGRQPAARLSVGPRLDHIAAYAIRAPQQVGEDHHLHTHGERVVDGYWCAVPSEDGQSGNHATVMEDPAPRADERVEVEGPAEADHEADGEQGDGPARTEPRAQPLSDGGADRRRQHEIADVTDRYRRRQAAPGHILRPPRRHARQGRRELCVHRPVIRSLNPGERDRRDAEQQQWVRATAADAQIHPDGGEDDAAAPAEMTAP